MNCNSVPNSYGAGHACVCSTGFYGSLTQSSGVFSGTCNACDTIDYSNGIVSCTGPGNSVPANVSFTCDPGFDYVDPAESGLTRGYCKGT